MPIMPGTSSSSPNTQSLIPNTSSILRRYLPLTKPLQTGLLLVTGLAGYLSAAGPVEWGRLLAMAGSLALAVSGSTILNMAFDRDIDSIMSRTVRRPLPAGLVLPAQAWRLGALTTALGIGWGLALAPLFGAIVFMGFFFDVGVYTVLLKRRTPFSIVIGGLSGGMPVLAGRALAVGGIDLVGLLLALGVLFWIPTHILTFAMRHHDDYCLAGVPTFPQVYGFGVTRGAIALSALAAAITMIVVASLTGAGAVYLRGLIVLGAALLALALATLARPSERLNFALFKFASLYMLGAMIIVAL